MIRILHYWYITYNPFTLLLKKVFTLLKVKAKFELFSHDIITFWQIHTLQHTRRLYSETYMEHETRMSFKISIYVLEKMCLMHLGVENCSKPINKSVKIGSVIILIKVWEQFYFWLISNCISICVDMNIFYVEIILLIRFILQM